jgi:vitamin B12 transporter
MATAVLLVFLGALSRLIPHPPNFVALGALALYSGARLPRRWAWMVPLSAMALADFVLDLGSGPRTLSLVRLTIYATFAAIVLAGRLLRRRSDALALAGFSVGASILFFATSNLAEWASSPLYPKTAAGLTLCYGLAVPFFWNTLAADLAGTAVLFGLDALSRRRSALASTVAVLVVLILSPAALFAQALPPTSESIVVTATATPEEEKQLGVATTVITREEIQKSGRVTVLELLRSVPALNVVQSGSDGSQTSIFLRGTNSTQTLVLVDGARVNSAYFPGYDFSGLTTENVERIEIVRGPFSALYGSEAIGGVVQIFTRPPQEGFSGSVTAEGGNADTASASAFVTGGSGPLSVAASYRFANTNGDVPNSNWRENNGSARVDWQASADARIGIEGSILSGKVGSPGPVGMENPAANTVLKEERLALPVNVTLSPTNHLNGFFATVWSKPEFNDPEGQFGAYASQTDARTVQAQVSDSASFGPHTVTAIALWTQSSVTSTDTYGTSLDGQQTTIWGIGAQDSVTLGQFLINGGVRYDGNSQFGSAVSPRGSIAWLSKDQKWKVRAGGGSAFRAPTVGELYFPFYGNPDLKPERSVSWEAGGEAYVGKGGRVEVTYFWNDLKDLIVYDFHSSKTENIGSARTQGVEVGYRQQILAPLALQASYTYTDAVDRTNDTPLLRRPKNIASLTVAWQPLPALSIEVRGLYTGTRADANPITSDPLVDPSYFRLDLFASWQFGTFAPYLRINNLTDASYDEAAGYPAAGIRAAGGVAVKF